MAESGAPAPQTLGAHNPYKDPVAEMQQKVAKEAAKSVAKDAQKQTKAGFVELKAFIMENPASIKVISFLIGLTLLVLSVLGCTLGAMAFGGPREWLTNFYNIFFGLIICICEGRESWMACFCNIQERLFHQFFFLATVTGRATFYIFVGSMMLLVLAHIPGDYWYWQLVYVVLGFALVMIALCQYFLFFCGRACGCTSHRDALETELDAKAPTAGEPPASTAHASTGETAAPAPGAGRGYGQLD
mmetsp:Transcript_31279/g.71418  ORF Transcript_31279/g.71418 Transcript_31279/m.71418 type:complete len:245 (-) Transcript_31279:94-828(-)